RNHDRVRAQAAMRVSTGVRVGNRVSHLDAQFQRAADVHRPSAHFLPERLSLQIFEDDEDAAVVLADVEKGGDVWMRQRGQATGAIDERTAPCDVDEIKW